MRRIVSRLALALALLAGPASAQEGGAAMSQPSALGEVFAAIRADDAEALARLLDADPSLAGAREGGLSAISFAAYMGRPALAEAVRARRGTPDVFEAAILGEVEVVRAALVAGQNVDDFAPDGFTLLGLAVFFGHPELARALIDVGADPSLRADNAQNVGPIHAAVARGDLASLEALLLAGGDPNLPQQQGVMPLHSAGHTGSAAAAGLLLLFGADPAARDAQGRTAADHAREMGHAALAERLERAQR